MFKYTSPGIYKQKLIVLPPSLTLGTAGALLFNVDPEICISIVSCISYVNNATDDYDYLGKFNIRQGNTGQFYVDDAVTGVFVFNAAINLNSERDIMNWFIRSEVAINSNSIANNFQPGAPLRLIPTQLGNATQGDGTFNFLITYFEFSI